MYSSRAMAIVGDADRTRTLIEIDHCTVEDMESMEGVRRLATAFRRSSRRYSEAPASSMARHGLESDVCLSMGSMPSKVACFPRWSSMASKVNCS